MGIEFDNSGLAADIFGVRAEAIVNPVNCVGRMGKGLALAFKERFPAILRPYQQACHAGWLRPGRILAVQLDSRTGAISDTGDLHIVNLPTKVDWRDDSKLEWIDQGLSALADWLAENRIASVALPKIGSGLGNLAWSDVAVLIEKRLSHLQNTRIIVLGASPTHATGTRAEAQSAPAVKEFSGEHRYLSNMYLAPVMWGDEVTPARIWPCNELPYVLAKTTIAAERAGIVKAYDDAERNSSGSGSYVIKKLGRGLTLRPDWDAVKIDVMRSLVRDKFARNPQLAQKLLKTGNAQIQEGNKWGDTTWGVSLIDIEKRNIRAGDGRNELGKLIMETRSAIANKTLAAPTQAPEKTATETNGTPKATGLGIPLPKEVVNLRSLPKPMPADVLNCSRYGTATFRDGTKLGNPYVMSEHGGKDGSREDVIRKFAGDLANHLDKPGFPEWLAREASGKRLACFCAPAACHCDVIKAVATAVIEGRDPKAAVKTFLSTTAVASSDQKAVYYYAGIGSRETPDDVLATMEEIGRLMAQAGWVLGSGGADGADINFEKGCEAANGAREIFIPWRTFSARSETEKTGYVPNRGKGQLFVGVDEKALTLASTMHPAWDRFTKPGKDWKKDPAPAQMLHARNGYQVLGPKLDRPAHVVICYTEGGQLKGGTSQALRLALSNGIEVINMGSPRWRNATAAEIVAEANAIAIRAEAARAEVLAKPAQVSVKSAEAQRPAPVAAAQPLPAMKNRGLMR